MHGLLLLLFYAPKSDTKGRSGYGVYRVRKAGVYLPFIKRYIEIETRGRSASCAARPEGAGEGSRPQGASMRSQRLAGILDRRAAWIYSPARASPRKRIDHDCARGSRHLSCNLRPIRAGDLEEGEEHAARRASGSGRGESPRRLRPSGKPCVKAVDRVSGVWYNKKGRREPSGAIWMPDRRLAPWGNMMSILPKRG